MAQNLSTYIALPGTTAAAFEHWHKVFGGELTLVRYRDMPAMEGMPFEPDPDMVAHAELTLAAGKITGCDTFGAEELPIRDTAYSLLYATETEAAARELIARIVDGGGAVGMPFEPAPWGGHYGQVFDRFGVMWAFVCD